MGLRGRFGSDRAGEAVRSPMRKVAETAAATMRRRERKEIRRRRVVLRLGVGWWAESWKAEATEEESEGPPGSVSLSLP